MIARRYTRGSILIALAACLLSARRARAEDGGNEVCPALSAAADDVRERYDDHGRLVHQLRLQQSRVVEEIAILHQRDHAVARTELTPGHIRIARTTWKDDHVTFAECQVDGVRTAYATYRYRDEHLESVEKHFWEAPANPEAGATATLQERIETVRFAYDADGQLVQSEVRATDGKLLSRVLAERAAPKIPIQVALSAGGSYQSDTELYDFSAGLGIHRRPRVQQIGRAHV